jgi:hypothetical protein
MNHLLILTLSFSILIPAIIGAVRIKKTDTMLHPFIFCIWVAAFNEMFSAILTSFNINTAFNNNIYVLAEALLIGWQFRNWGLFGFYKHAFSFYILLVIAGWLIETSFLTELHTINSSFRIACSFLIVLMSIHVNNKLIYHHRGRLLKSPAFFIGTGLIFYFTFKIFIEAFLLYGLEASPGFYKSLFVILAWINLFTNLLFAYAILCIPKKIYYIEPY